MASGTLKMTIQLDPAPLAWLLAMELSRLDAELDDLSRACRWDLPYLDSQGRAMHPREIEGPALDARDEYVDKLARRLALKLDIDELTKGTFDHGKHEQGPQ